MIVRVLMEVKMVKGKIILNVESGKNSIESTFDRKTTLICMKNLSSLLKADYKDLKFKKIGYKE